MASVSDEAVTLSANNQNSRMGERKFEMKNLLKSRLVVGLFLVLVLGVASATIWVTRGSNNDVKRIRIENKTRALIVESIKDLERVDNSSRFAVTFRNDYDKSIIAYRLQVTDVSTAKDSIGGVERDGFMDGWLLPSNGTDSTRFSAASKGEIVLTIAAVMFENGVGDGNKEDLERLKEVRTGVKMAYEQIVPIIRGTLKSDAAVASIESAENEISKIGDKEVPMNSRSGFAEAKSYIGSELRDLKNKLRSNSNFTADIEIIQKLTKIEETLAKL